MRISRQPSDTSTEPISDGRWLTANGRRPSSIGHRGASGIAHENSPSAFRLAKQLGADGVELDVHATGDGVLVVHHDYTIAGAGLISGLSSSDIAHHPLPNGEEIPTLAQALDLLDGLDVWVEVKSLPPRFDGRLLETLDRGPSPQRYAVHSFDHRIVARLGQRPKLSRGVLLASYLLDPLAVLKSAGADVLWQEAHLIDQDLVQLMHKAGCRIIAWTANTEEEIARLAQLGVDGICGNFPDLIHAVVTGGKS
ncbi:MAG TPA: glycerophosphodiester phosphodiesterase [Gemmatimonadales bacterium]|nr:glycerophosphodiester phosphodiesterase [Gemmatimonadales bacterium]